MPDPRILIVRIGAMGDILHALPAVTGLRAALPGAHIAWAVEPRWLPLLEAPGGARPLIDHVHLVNTRAWKQHPASLATLRDIAQLRRSLRSEHYDLAVDLQGSIRSAVIGSMAGAASFLGADAARERPARLLYRTRVSTTAPNVIDQAAEILTAATNRPSRPAAITLPTDAAADSWAARFSPGFVLIAPTAGWGAKEWSAANYATLARALTQRGLNVLINATPGAPNPVANTIAEASGARIVPSTLPQMIALTRRAALVLGGDTGPVHLGAALGRPTVALFGPTDPARTGPAFPHARFTILRHPASRTDHTRHAATEAGLAQVRVEEVLNAVLEMLVPEGDSTIG